MATLQEIIAAEINKAIGSAVESEIDRALSGLVGQSKVAPAVKTARKSAAQPTAQPIGTRGDRIAYQLMRQLRKSERLRPNDEKVYRALAAAKSPLTNTEIEHKTGMKEKSVESSIYALRHMKLVRTLDAASRKVSRKSRKSA